MIFINGNEIVQIQYENVYIIQFYTYMNEDKLLNLSYV